MKTKVTRRSNGRHRGKKPRLRPVAENARRLSSATAVAAEALRTGVIPLTTSRRRDMIPGESERIRVGDPDDQSLANEYVGEETPGGSAPTPDQNSVDDIGRVYGLQEEDTGALRCAAEVLTRRDRRRQELQAPPKPQA